MRPATLEPQSSQDNFAVLQEAFRHFSETSAKLETKYEALRIETERLRAELQQKDIEIKKSERLATLGKTAAAIAHEVRNPLGAIKLFLSLLRQDVSDRPESLKLVRQIVKSVETLNSVVSNILQFAREQKTEFAPLNLHSLIHEQLALIKPLAGSGMQLELRLEASPFIMGDEHALRRVFYNVFLNAVQATRGQGRMSVASGDLAGAGVRVRISDNGPGIAPELLENIFDPFVTSRNEGTGLGLAVVKRIIGQHGGSIDAGNDNGAVFEIRLPRKQKRVNDEH